MMMMKDRNSHTLFQVGLFPLEKPLRPAISPMEML